MDNAREACTRSWLLDVKFTLYLSTIQENCSYKKQMLKENLPYLSYVATLPDIEQ